jgi:DHA1 family tetracycline resistance protein-like MFS transporter
MVELKRKVDDIRLLLKRPVISPLLWSGMSFWIGFTIMHVVFILFTMMPASSGGLSFSESDNGIVFAFIGLIGMVTQGGLIGPLTQRFGSSRLIAGGLLIAGLGLAAIPHIDIGFAWTGMLVTSILIAFGNGLFTPSNMAMLSNHSAAHERGLVMGVNNPFPNAMRIEVTNIPVQAKPISMCGIAARPRPAINRPPAIKRLEPNLWVSGPIKPP